MSIPKEQWQIADALVYSVDWIQGSRNDEPHYDVVYSYKVGEERYTGQFSDYGADKRFHADDTISIRYCPEHPAKSFCPDARAPLVSRWMLFAVMMGTAAVVFLMVYFSNRHH